MRANPKGEPTVQAWLWRALLGPATLLDGLLSTLTVGSIHAGLALAVARRLAGARADLTSSTD